MVEWDGVFYSVPPEVVGQIVEARQPVASDPLELRSGGRLVAGHQLAAPGQTAVGPAHRAAAETIALGRHRRRRSHLRATDRTTAAAVCRRAGARRRATTTSTTPIWPLATGLDPKAVNRP